MLEKVVRVSREEFETESGNVYPIVPPLEDDVTPEEFQEHYERAINLIQSIKYDRSDNQGNKIRVEVE
jgi:hypothetical protein